MGKQNFICRALSFLTLELDSWDATGGEVAEEIQRAWMKVLSLAANAAVIATATPSREENLRQFGVFFSFSDRVLRSEQSS